MVQWNFAPQQGACPREDARRGYDSLNGAYELLAAGERSAIDAGLCSLAAQAGEACWRLAGGGRWARGDRGGGEGELGPPVDVVVGRAT